MGRIIGIDLGTTTCEMAYIKNGKPELIVNNLGDRITPSVIGVTDDGEYIAGIVAKRQYILKPDNTAMEVKRHIGTQKKINLGDKEYLPEEISAILLKNLKEYAEEFLGEQVTEAVITVPAGFDDLQRQATKEAGEMAGFKVERIINEPTAAALAYGINNLETDEKVIVYDLGGGTFDVTVLELFEGVLDVQASRGNNKLGGKDFDERIEKFIIKDFKEKHGIDLRGNKKSMARIKEAAENAKKELTTLETTVIQLPFIAMDENQNPLEVNMKLTRGIFEELIKDLVVSTEKCIDEALEAAGYREEEIDVVLAVGGSSRIPCVKKLLQRKFPNKVKTEVNPDEAVALGAAVQGGIKNDEISSEDSVLITDVCRYTLGISMIVELEDGRVLDGIFDPLIAKDSKIPVTAKKIYQTVYDGQESVVVNIYQGDSRFVSENIKISELELGGIPAGPAGMEAIEVAFSYDINGKMKVEATILSNGKVAEKVIDMKQNAKNIVKENKEVEKEIDFTEWINYPLAIKVKSTIKIAETRINKFSGSTKDKINHLIIELKQAVINDNETKVDEIDTKLTDILFELN